MPPTTVRAMLNHSINRRECAGMMRSSAASTTWPPSSGSTGTRLNRPITGPVHQMARAGALDAYELRSSGSIPIANNTARLTPICTAGPASEIPARSHGFSGRTGTNDA